MYLLSRTTVTSELVSHTGGDTECNNIKSEYLPYNTLGRMIGFLLNGPTYICTILAVSNIPIKCFVKLKSFLQYKIAKKVVKVIIVGFVFKRE